MCIEQLHTRDIHLKERLTTPFYKRALLEPIITLLVYLFIMEYVILSVKINRKKSQDY